jgi:hypothetical protein
MTTKMVDLRSVMVVDVHNEVVSKQVIVRP